jgi:hypothetical protein
MRQCSVNKQSHNLNIAMYSFKEILALFELPYDFDVEGLKRAKTKVLRMHPDKSRLPSDYFLFYKKAFDILVSYFQENQKTTKEVPNTEQIYVPPESKQDEHSEAFLRQQANMKMQDDAKQKEFAKQFHQFFEENMVRKPIENQRNDWFKHNDPLYTFDAPGSSKNIGQAMDTIKTTVKQSAMIQYKGVQELGSSSANAINRYFDEEDDDPNEYISSDPFSKLKFEDLRKVHRDQTVFAVSERDIDGVQQYSSMDHLTRDRNLQNQSVKPMEEAAAMRMMMEQEEGMKKRAAERQHAANLRSMEYEKKNESAKAMFLRLT